jgi:hypothetical protein
MRDFIYIGSSPPDETCVQVGSENYYPRSRHECHVYIRQLRRALGNEPDGARLAIRRDEHDFGAYLSVICYYDATIQESIDYALRCEGQGPEQWDAEAKRELAERKEADHGSMD